MGTPYDVIIAGAGPAGLSLASELGKNLSVLLIDAHKIGATHKMWTSEEAILKKTGYLRFAGARFRAAYVQAYQGRKYPFGLDYCTMDERKVLQYWKQKCLANNVKLISNCKYKHRRASASFIRVATTKGTFTAKYLVDCMGVSSPIARQHKLWQNALYIPIIGEYVEYASLPEEIVVAESLEPNRVSFFELFPATASTSVIYSFIVTNKLLNPRLLENLHAYNKAHSPIADKLRRARSIHKVQGIIPVGRFSQKSVARTVFFGDTALFGTCVLGVGFSKILLHAKPFADYVKKILKNNNVLPQRYYPGCVEDFNAQLQLIMLMIFHKGSHKDVDLLYRALSGIPRKQRVRFAFALTTTGENVAITRKILALIPLKRIFQLLPLNSPAFIFKLMAKFIDKHLQSRINAVFHRHCPAGKLSYYVSCKKCMCLICKCAK